MMNSRGVPRGCCMAAGNLQDNVFSVSGSYLTNKKAGDPPTGCNPVRRGANLTISAIAIVISIAPGWLRRLFRALAAQEDDSRRPALLIIV